MRAAVSLPVAAALAGAGLLGYAWGYERKAFRLRRYNVPVLPPGSPAVRILHLSDLHMTAGQPWKVSWVRSLAELEPDLVVDTGDNLGAADGIPALMHALEPLLSRPGAFVPGSNDWFAAIAKNPVRYLLPDSGERVHGERL